jgi:hypothetical protein
MRWRFTDAPIAISLIAGTQTSGERLVIVLIDRDGAPTVGVDNLQLLLQ